MRELKRALAKVEHRLARTLLALPERVKMRLAGGAPLVRDGLTLHAELQMLLALRALRPTPALSEGTPEQARRRFRRDTLVHAGERVQVGRVDDLVIDVGRPLKLRHYAPGAASATTPSSSAATSSGHTRAPLLVFLHGGGFALGDLDTHDPACRLLCKHAGVHVLAVDYRLSPEAPYPSAVQDARAALRWAAENALSLGADPTRLALGGDSAGGNLTAAVSKVAREDGVVLSGQMLLYPAIDRVVVRPSLELFAEGFFLSRADIDHFERWYLGEGGDRQAPGHAPLSGGALSDLPAALVVTAGFDPLRDEGEAYADALREAGNVVVKKRFGGLVHGFVNLVGLSAACRAAVIEVATDLRALLDASHAAARGARSSSESADLAAMVSSRS